jgi:hypothetical protein
MEKFKAYGATSTRECPFLVHSDGTTITPRYMPFAYRNGKYDLEQFNPLYFQNLAEMARIANGEGVVFYFSLFGPHCNWPTSPWVINRQGISGFYELSPRADRYRRTWTTKVLETLRGKYVVGFELCNEPNDNRFISMAPKIMRLLRENGIPMHRIISGIRYLSPDRIKETNPLYRAVKKILKKNKLWNKRRMFSKVVHHVTVEFFQEYWHMQKHWSRCFISDDGCHPKKSALLWQNVLKEWFGAVKLKKNKFFKTRGAFEHIYRYPQDDIAGIYGIAKAVEDVYGIKMYTRTPTQSETVIAYEGITLKETAQGFKIKKRKWYDILYQIIKAIYEILTGKK